MSAKMTHYYSNEFCSDKRARTQEQLLDIVAKIRKGCKIEQICEGSDYVCTIYTNKAIGLRYWVQDTFGHINSIDEAREYC